MDKGIELQSADSRLFDYIAFNLLFPSSGANRKHAK